MQAALAEASDNVRFLTPLRRHLEKLSLMDDFVALVSAAADTQRLHQNLQLASMHAAACVHSVSRCLHAFMHSNLAHAPSFPSG